MGRPTLNQLQAKVSTCDLSMEGSNGSEVEIIYGDKKISQECYFATVNEVGRKWRKNLKIKKNLS